MKGVAIPYLGTRLPEDNPATKMAEFPLKLTLAAPLPTLPVQQALKELRTFLDAQSDVEIVAIDQGDGVDFATMQTDLVVVLGGDGAILTGVSSNGIARQFPMLGINLGRLGFLADLSPAEFTRITFLTSSGEGLQGCPSSDV